MKAMPEHSVKKSVKLKFDGEIPMMLEYKLVNEYGFNYFSRGAADNWVVYEKKFGEPVKKKITNFMDLPPDTIKSLQTRCNNIVSCFQDPDAHKDMIKMRLTNMAKTCTALEEAWVLNWIKYNVDEEDFREPFDADIKKGNLL